MEYVLSSLPISEAWSEFYPGLFCYCSRIIVFISVTKAQFVYFKFVQ